MKLPPGTIHRITTGVYAVVCNEFHEKVGWSVYNAVGYGTRDAALFPVQVRVRAPLWAHTWERSTTRGRA